VCDVCVVGAGAGGLTAAMVAAEAGLRVVLVEAGGWITPDHANQREADMLPLLYWEAAGRTTADRRIRLHQGKGIGGSTLHNLNLCKRIDPHVLRSWQGLGRLDLARWDGLFDETEALLGVCDVPAEAVNRHNQLLRDACERLGWRWGALRHNRSGCVGSGYCELGCAYDAKNNAAKVCLPRAIDHGATVVHHAFAVALDHRAGRVQSLQVRSIDDRGDPGDRHLTVQARTFVAAGSATGTPALLQRSDVPDPHAQVGRTLRIHPAVVAAGEFDDPVHAWRGIPQTIECTEFLRFSPEDGRACPRNIWIVPAFGHPMGTATMLPALGGQHRAFMLAYPRVAVFCAMLHDGSRGNVTPSGDTGVRVDYQLTEIDAHELAKGLQRLAEALFAAGARKVWIPTPQPLQVTDPAQTRSLADLDVRRLGPTAVHPMGSCPMHDDPRRGAVDSAGRHHHLANLWVADGSLYPTSIGGPPQLGIYALGLHVGRGVVADLRAASTAASPT